MNFLEKVALVIAIPALVFSSSAAAAMAQTTALTTGVPYGGVNVFYVPASGTCPAHMWIYDFRTNTSYALSNVGGTIYQNGNVFVVGKFILGEHSIVPNIPCLVVVYPPVPLPYPVYNINQEGTS